MATHPLFVLGADHAGFELKESLKKQLQKLGVEIDDQSPCLVEGDDYPPIAKRVAQTVAKDAHAQGLLVCGTGLGMDIAANRLKGVRAVVIRNAEEAAIAREHNHANILVLGGRIISSAKAKTILGVWMKTPPSKAARHLRRVKQLDET